MNTNAFLHHLDVAYASLPDHEVEAIWRTGSDRDSAVELAILRQLVLRALDVIEPTCSEEGSRLGLLEHELERASNEIALKLFARLHRDRRVSNIRALAHAFTLEVLADPRRLRTPSPLRFADSRPRLRLVQEKGGTNERFG